MHHVEPVTLPLLLQTFEDKKLKVENEQKQQWYRKLQNIGDNTRSYKNLQDLQLAESQIMP